MSDTVKIVIEISKSAYEEMSNYGTDRVDFDIRQMIKNGTPLSEVLTEIKNELEEHKYSREYCSDHRIDFAIDMGMVRIILDTWAEKVRIDETNN